MPANYLSDLPSPSCATNSWTPPAEQARTPLFRRLRNVIAPALGAPVRCLGQDPLNSFDWPEEVTLRAIGDAIASKRGLKINVMPIPEGFRHQEISGLTTVAGHTAYVFYDASLSPLNHEQTILHEYAHILHGDVRAGSDCTHLRSMFDDPIEKRAERTGMQLLETMRWKQRDRLRQQDSEVFAFFSGSDRSRGL